MAQVESEVRTKPMDADELLPCTVCQRGVGSAGPVFYEVTGVQCVIDPNVQKMAAMETLMYGSVPLARIFSPDNTVAQRLMPGQRQLFCAECAMKPMAPIMLVMGD